MVHHIQLVYVPRNLTNLGVFVMSFRRKTALVIVTIDKAAIIFMYISPYHVKNAGKDCLIVRKISPKRKKCYLYQPTLSSSYILDGTQNMIPALFCTACYASPRLVL